MTSSPTPAPASPPVKRRTWLAAALAAGVAAAAGGAWHLRRQTAPSDAVDDRLWNIALPQLDGQTMAMRQWLGHPIIVNFWATWCAPCVQELPLLNAFHQAQPQWRVVGVAVDTPENVARFVKRFSLQFPVGIAGAQGVQLAQSLGSTGGLPFTLMSDASGRIRATKSGQIHAQDLDSWLQMA
ncbi:TlpA family protein disulfide reductase [Lampropedia cohaerens]|nr:TlpA disulfide reductase family protein [Lampropedia cohaerens]